MLCFAIATALDATDNYDRVVEDCVKHCLKCLSWIFSVLRTKTMLRRWEYNIPYLCPHVLANRFCSLFHCMSRWICLSKNTSGMSIVGTNKQKQLHYSAWKRDYRAATLSSRKFRINRMHVSPGGVPLEDRQTLLMNYCVLAQTLTAKTNLVSSKKSAITPSTAMADIVWFV